MRLFLDANVIFSAAHSSSGRAMGLFLLARSGRCSLLTSPHALEEAKRNIQLKYPTQSDILSSLLSDLIVTVEATADKVRWAAKQSLPPQDAPILAAAVQARADLLVTGDRTHFGRLFGKTLRGVEVISLVDALARVML